MGVCVCVCVGARACGRVCVCMCVRVGADSVKHLLQLCGFENSLLFCGAVFLTLKPILVRFMNQHAGLFSIQLQGCILCRQGEREAQKDHRKLGSYCTTLFSFRGLSAALRPWI